MGRKSDGLATLGAITGTWVIARLFTLSPLFEIPLVFVHLDHVASFIVNANLQGFGGASRTPTQHEQYGSSMKARLNQVWKRKHNGLLVRVSGLIFLEPKRVIWRALPNQSKPDACHTITEIEFKNQYEYHPPRA